MQAIVICVIFTAMRGLQCGGSWPLEEAGGKPQAYRRDACTRHSSHNGSSLRRAIAWNCLPVKEQAPTAAAVSQCIRLFAGKHRSRESRAKEKTALGQRCYSSAGAL